MAAATARCVASIARRLEERGASVWYDARIDGGPDWSDGDVADALNGAGHHGRCSSPRNATARARSQRELALADALGKPVVPILIEDTAPRGALLLRPRRPHWMQAYPEPAPAVRRHRRACSPTSPARPCQRRRLRRPPTLAERDADHRCRDRRHDPGRGRTRARAAARAERLCRPARRTRKSRAAPPQRRAIALNVVTLGAYGLLAQRRAIRSFRANIRKL